MTTEDYDKRPGQKALENMALLKRECSVFKVPKNKHKKISKNKCKVLDEDQYVEGIGKIIQRDFFPDLEKLKAQNEYLEAVENKDYHKLREITAKYSGSRPQTDPRESPKTFDTPNPSRPDSPENHSNVVQKKDGNVTEQDSVGIITANHGLDSFLSLHTSEDNESFNRIAELENKKRRTKHEQQLSAEIISKQLADSALQLPSIEQQANGLDLPNEVDTWSFKACNHIMYVPNDGDNSNLTKPELIHQNTRLQSNPFNYQKNKVVISELAKSQEKNQNGKIDVDGTCIVPSKKQHEYVHTPSPRPGYNESPLMTWGEIEGTPFRLDGGDTPLPNVGAGTAFRMLESGAREQLALKLAEATRRKRTPTPRPNTGFMTPRTATERLATMSPAARKLAAKHLMISPLAKPKSKTPLLCRPATSEVTNKANAPKIKNIVSSKLETHQTLTDNLLNINVEKRARPRAHDFFN